jgi:hypothetical protein
MDLYENYFKQAKKYLGEAEEDEELDEVPEDIETDEPVEGDVGEEGAEDEVQELDMTDPVCPSCGAQLIPVGEIDTTEEDEDGNPIYDEEVADAIDLLQGMGFVLYKPADEEGDEEGVDDDLAGSDDEDFGDDDFDDDEIPEDED